MQVVFELEDIKANEMETHLGQWVLDFSQKVGDAHCLRRPRFSELRPAWLRSF